MKLLFLILDLVLPLFSPCHRYSNFSKMKGCFHDCFIWSHWYFYPSHKACWRQNINMNMFRLLCQTKMPRQTQLSFTYKQKSQADIHAHSQKRTKDWCIKTCSLTLLIRNGNIFFFVFYFRLQDELILRNNKRMVQVSKATLLKWKCKEQLIKRKRCWRRCITLRKISKEDAPEFLRRSVIYIYPVCHSNFLHYLFSKRHSLVLCVHSLETERRWKKYIFPGRTFHYYH